MCIINNMFYVSAVFFGGRGYDGYKVTMFLTLKLWTLRVSCFFYNELDRT